ncbi:MAG: HAMP domain-containing histidine kinase [Bacteroidetes bacterium]|nr:HAMP domain-containing histidine kinase [Bacteroidota bacterium]MCH8524942.1 HAMP domain-containing histidine kinase [Balneolales bacterium]
MKAKSIKGKSTEEIQTALTESLADDGRPKTGGEVREDGGRKTRGIYNPKLTVRTKSKNSQILIEIEDNGPGIPDAIKDKILQPFFTTKKGTQGTGLGLSITNDIVKAHGGSIEITSLPGKSSTFTIYLPI